MTTVSKKKSSPEINYDCSHTQKVINIKGDWCHKKVLKLTIAAAAKFIDQYALSGCGGLYHAAAFTS